jgi:TP901 family phage tail tape measure protein
MSAVEAVTSATGVTLENLTNTAKRMGATTLFRASEAAEGMKFLGMAGFEANEIIEAIPATLDLAIAGNIGLAESADLASNILRQFNMDARDTVKIADVLAATAADTNTSVHQMGEAFKFAGPIASSLGLSVDELAAAIGTLGDAGIQASLAGTQLRQTLLQSVSGGSDRARAALTQMGLTIDDINVETKGFVTVLETLAKGNINAAQAAAIFQRRAAAGVLVLTQNIDLLKEQIEVNEKSTGAAKEMATIMANNLVGAWKIFRSSVEAAQLSLGTGDSGLSGSLKVVLNQMTGVMRVWLDMADVLGPTREELEELAEAGNTTRPRRRSGSPWLESSRSASRRSSTKWPRISSRPFETVDSRFSRPSYRRRRTWNSREPSSVWRSSDCSLR